MKEHREKGELIEVNSDYASDDEEYYDNDPEELLLCEEFDNIDTATAIYTSQDFLRVVDLDMIKRAVAVSPEHQELDCIDFNPKNIIITPRETLLHIVEESYLTVPQLVILVKNCKQDLQYNPSPCLELPKHPTIQECSRHFTLNAKQHQIFVKCALAVLDTWQHRLRIMMSHEQLVAHLVGPAGYGKSRVIDALHTFTSLHGNPMAVTATAFTGNAAQNVDGLNVHALLGWLPFMEYNSEVTHKQKLIFAQTSLLIIDEVSAMSQELLGCINHLFKRMAPPERKTRLFGGMHILIVGDWLQLPPTAKASLFTPPIDTECNANIYRAKREGFELWKNINYVVYLVMNIRHASNPKWVNILERLRLGLCTWEDVEFINKFCILDKLTLNSTFCPYITSSNPERFHYNRQAIHQFAIKNNEPIYNIAAQYKQTSVPQFDYLRPDNKTGRIAMLLECCIGMPMTCSKNKPLLGLANGTFGTLIGFKWHPQNNFTEYINESGVLICTPSRPPLAMYIKLHKAALFRVEGLPDNVIPVVPVCVQVKYTRDQVTHTQATWQIPLISAFSITTDKAQGLTLKSCILGTQRNAHRKTPPTQILYVAMSRVIVPRHIGLAEPMSLNALNSFAPSRELRQLDRDLKARDKNEYNDFFY